MPTSDLSIFEDKESYYSNNDAVRKFTKELLKCEYIALFFSKDTGNIAGEQS